MNASAAIILFFVAILLFIYLFYPYQLENMTLSRKTFGEDPTAGFHNLPDHYAHNCRVLYRRDKEEDDCTACSGQEYRKIEVAEGTTHVVDGVVLTPGHYCLMKHLPDCDPTKGILTISGNRATCLCRFPQFFDGPSCSTRVACPGNPLVDKDGNILHTDQFHDYYALGARCRCDAYDTDGHPIKSVGYECLIDPCMYPGVYLPEDSGWIEQPDGTRACVCKGDILSNRDGPYSKCSNCNQNVQGPASGDYTRRIALDCANQHSRAVDLLTMYPCYTLNTDSNCGQATFVFGDTMQ